ncbi:aldo/keto reductase [Candidatus Woesearchaeota archaeon]|nr:aldo/keto reductase [Candidatus Woesearchaeota archaeon]
MKSIKLVSGYEMPVLGIGTWGLIGEKCKEAVTTALKLGYTHIDTADYYHNHKEIGEVIKKFNRKKLFITTKVQGSGLDYDSVLKDCDKSLRELQTNYIDLYLIHWPNSSIQIEETLKAFKKLVKDKKVRSIGISNFSIRLMKEAIEKSEIPISVNQVEYHPYLNQEALLESCKEENVVLTAYSPLARGDILDDKLLKEITKKYNRTISQLVLRWLVQKRTVVIPKASSEAHIKENMDIFSWKISEEDMNKISSIDKRERVVNSSFSEFED